MDIRIDRQFQSCRKEIWSGSVCREEMIECVVPDTYPDIGSIIDVSGQVFIRGKDASSEKLTVECTVAVKVLYTADGEEGIFCLETQLPAVLTAEAENAAETTDIVALPKIDTLDVRLLNPRKILTKAEVSAFIRCFEESGIAVSGTVTEVKGLHLLESSLEAFPVCDVKEKTFVITDELTLPAVPEGYSDILSGKTELHAGDVKFVGSKLIFKGEASMHVLAQPNGSIYPVCLNTEIGFSQIIELENEADSADITLCLTAAYLSIEENESGKCAVNAELHILAQAIACRGAEINYIADVYSNKKECKYVSEKVSVPRQRNDISLRDTFRSTLTGHNTVREIISTSAVCSSPAITEKGINTKVSLRCMYVDDNGQLCAANKIETICMETDAKGTASLKCENAYASASAEGIEVRFTVEAVITEIPVCEIECVTDIELAEREQIKPLPSVYVVPVSENCDLWNTAKKYYSTPELIEAYNSEEDGILLIPVE